MFKGERSRLGISGTTLNTFPFVELSKLSVLFIGKLSPEFSTSSPKKTGLNDGLSLPTLEGGEDSAEEPKDPLKLELKLIDVGRCTGGGDWLRPGGEMCWKYCCCVAWAGTV